jgi:hypothetical protein
MEKIIAALGLQAKATEEDCVKAINDLKQIRSADSKLEKAILEKMAAGLSREIAVQVIKDQAAEDARVAAEKKK